MVIVPADIRQQLDISSGDKIQWQVEENGSLSVELLRQREGVFDDFEPVDAGEMDAVEAEHEFGAE